MSLGRTICLSGLLQRDKKLLFASVPFQIMKDVKVDERRGQGVLTPPIVCRCVRHLADETGASCPRRRCEKAPLRQSKILIAIQRATPVGPTASLRERDGGRAAGKKKEKEEKAQFKRVTIQLNSNMEELFPLSLLGRPTAVNKQPSGVNGSSGTGSWTN